jgi:hypothetical protein
VGGKLYTAGQVGAVQVHRVALTRSAQDVTMYMPNVIVVR